MKKYMESLSTKKIIKDQSLLGHEDIRHKIRILPELQAFIPPLLPDELRQLESNIRKDGCREALLVWPTTEAAIGKAESNNLIYVLVDGHNRYGICQRNGLDFRVNLVDFDSLESVRNFMLDNQLGRRNLTPEQTAYLRGLRYLGEKGERGKYDRQSTSLSSNPTSDHKGQNVPYDTDLTESSQIASNGLKSKKGTTTAQVLAKQFSVNEKTIKRDAAFAAGLEKLAPDLKAEVLSGKSGIKKTAIQQLAKSEIASGSITSPDDLLPLTSPMPKSGRTVVPDGLQQELQSLVSLLTTTTNHLPALCDEIIACATKLKNSLNENH